MKKLNLVFFTVEIILWPVVVMPRPSFSHFSWNYSWNDWTNNWSVKFLSIVTIPAYFNGIVTAKKKPQQPPNAAVLFFRAAYSAAFRRVCTWTSEWEYGWTSALRLVCKKHSASSFSFLAGANCHFSWLTDLRMWWYHYKLNIFGQRGLVNQTRRLPLSCLITFCSMRR